MENKNLTLAMIVLLIVVVGISVSYISKEEETYCIWKLITNSNSFFPDAIIWQDAVEEDYKEYELYQKILKEGEIKSIEIKCYILGKLDKYGSPIEVEE